MTKKLLILLTIIGTLLFSCSHNPTNKDKKDSAAFDTDSIRARGKLVAATDNNSTDYSLYRGKPIGFRKNSRSSDIVKNDYSLPGTGKVSQWDDLIKKYSETINWDWRLLASLICQESRFMPDVVSRVGAFGLMQIMPETGKHFGIDITSSPADNIKAGVMYINLLYKIFDPKIDDKNERTKFILASYNAGPGHVLDAMKLAEKNGMDPQRWDDNVAVWILKKSEPQYYNDIVVKNGYFKGKESVAFVMEVLERFEHYKNFIPENNVPISYIPHSRSAKLYTPFEFPLGGIEIQ